MAFSILKYLALNPGQTPYALETQLKIDRPTVHASLKLLQGAELVAITAQDKLPTGLTRKEFATTSPGLVALLQAHPEQIQISKSDVRTIASKNPQFLPMIFGKWEMFCRAKVDDLAYKYLMIAIRHTEDEIERLSDVAEGRKLPSSFAATGPMHRHDIYEGVLLRAPMFRSEDANRWAHLIRNDKELIETTEKEIERLQGEAEEDVRFWDDVLRELHGQKPPEVSILLDSEGYGNESDPELGFDFLEWWRYARAVALDEDKPLPRSSELVGQAVSELLEEIQSKKVKRH